MTSLLAYKPRLPHSTQQNHHQLRHRPSLESHLIKLSFAGALQRGRPLLHVSSCVRPQRQTTERRDHLPRAHRHTAGHSAGHSAGSVGRSHAGGQRCRRAGPEGREWRRTGGGGPAGTDAGGRLGSRQSAGSRTPSVGVDSPSVGADRTDGEADEPTPRTQ